MSSNSIFIVGVQRSGTTLLSAMLANHSRVSCGPETHFFHHLVQQDPSVICNPATWPTEAVEFLANISHKDYQGEPDKPLLEKYSLTKRGAYNQLKAKPPHVNSILSSITEHHMELMGKSRWIEKTPDHILYLEELRRYFPESPVIRIVRDPRDVSISLSKVPWGVKSFFQGLLFWSRLDTESNTFFNTDPNTYTIYFEKLVQSPETELTNLCDFLIEEFENDMLDTASTGKYLNSQQVPWKEKASKPIDKSRIFSWKKQLSPGDNKLAEGSIGDHLRNHDYPQTETYKSYIAIFPPHINILDFEDAFREFTQEGLRIWKLFPGELPRASVYLGDPGNEQWLGARDSGKVIRLFKILGRISKDILRGRRVAWVVNTPAPGWTGFSSQLLKLILSPFRFKISNSKQPDASRQNSSISN